MRNQHDASTVIGDRAWISRTVERSPSMVERTTLVVNNPCSNSSYCHSVPLGRGRRCGEADIYDEDYNKDFGGRGVHG